MCDVVSVFVISIICVLMLVNRDILSSIYVIFHVFACFVAVFCTYILKGNVLFQFYILN